MHITFAGHTINYTDNNNSNFFGTTTAEIEVGRGGLNSPLTLGAPPDSLNSLFIRKVRETAHHLGIWRSHSSLGGIRPGMRFLHEHNMMNIIIVQQQQMYNNRKSCGGKDPVSFSCSSRLVLMMVWHMPLYSIVPEIIPFYYIMVIQLNLRCKELKRWNRIYPFDFRSK